MISPSLPLFSDLLHRILPAIAVGGLPAAGISLLLTLPDGSTLPNDKTYRQRLKQEGWPHAR